MSEDQALLLDMLKLKELLVKKLNEGNFLLHPKDILDDVNKLIERYNKLHQ